MTNRETYHKGGILLERNLKTHRRKGCVKILDPTHGPLVGLPLLVMKGRFDPFYAWLVSQRVLENPIRNANLFSGATRAPSGITF